MARRDDAPRPRGSREPFVARGANDEQIGEMPDLEQSAQLRRYAAEHDLAIGVVHQLARDQEGAKAGAAHIDDVAQIDEQAARPGPDQCADLVRKGPGAGGIDAPVGFHDGDAVSPGMRRQRFVRVRRAARNPLDHLEAVPAVVAIIGDGVHQAANEMNAQAADLPPRQVRGQIGWRRLQRIERPPAVLDFDPHFIDRTGRPDRDLALRLRLVPVRNDIAERFVERDADIVNDRARNMIVGRELLDQRHGVADLRLTIRDAHFPMWH